MEILGVLALLVILAVAVGAIAVLGFVLKVTFKVILLPFWLLGLLLKGLVLLIGVVVAIVLAPLLLLSLLILLPLALFGGLVGAGIWAVA